MKTASNSDQPFLRLARTDEQTNRQTDKQTNRQTDKKKVNYIFGFDIDITITPAIFFIFIFNVQTALFYDFIICIDIRQQYLDKTNQSLGVGANSSFLRIKCT